MKKKLIILFFILTLGCIGCNTQSESGEEVRETEVEKERVMVYDTNQYQIFRRLHSYSMDYMGYANVVKTENENEYFCESEFINVIAKDDFQNTGITTYQIYLDGAKIHQFTKEDVFTYLSIHYVDVTSDGNKDVILVGGPNRGTNVGPHWMYVYDVQNDRTIDIFDKSGSLTNEQLKAIETYLDDEFYETFPEFVDIHYSRQWGRPCVDVYGRLYYWSAIAGEDPLMNIGDLGVMFSYDKDSESFFVSDVIYMPYYVEVESIPN